jgi:xanthine dehydrogenase accessory factor
MPRFYSFLPAALAEGRPFALGIISGVNGSSPQKLGAKALFFEDGRIVGTLGGGCLEAEVQDRARRALRTGEAATFELVLDHDFGWDDGLICGGKVRGLILPRAAEAAALWHALAEGGGKLTWGVRKDFAIVRDDACAAHEWRYREVVEPPCALWIAGSGHVAQSVAKLASQLDFEVTVFDDRATFATTQFFPEGTRFRIGYWDDLLQAALPGRPTFGLVVTRGHNRDALVLRRWIHEPFAFLGMIGSRRKARLILGQFRDEQLATEDEIARVQCPVGVDIGAVSVPEIGVSVVAEFIRRRAALAARAAQAGPDADANASACEAGEAATVS